MCRCIYSMCKKDGIFLQKGCATSVPTRVAQDSFFRNAFSDLHLGVACFQNAVDFSCHMSLSCSVCIFRSSVSHCWMLSIYALLLGLGSGLQSSLTTKLILNYANLDDELGICVLEFDANTWQCLNISCGGFFFLKAQCRSGHKCSRHT